MPPSATRVTLLPLATTVASKCGPLWLNRVLSEYCDDGRFGDPSQNSSKPWPIRDTNGMLTWTPEPQVFEDGLKDWLQMPTFLHARYLSSATPYRNDPELAAQLICEEGKSDGMGICLPVGPKPFAKMMQGVQSWTPFLYEQDWISATMEKSVAVVSSVTTGDAWLSGMNEAAGALNMTIQYSMSFSPAILHSTKLQQVTQIRGSGDYEVGSSQWQVGGTSMYYYALGAVSLALQPRLNSHCIVGMYTVPCDDSKFRPLLLFFFSSFIHDVLVLTVWMG